MGILASAGMAVTLIASRAAASTNRAFFIAFLLVEVGMQRENAAVGEGLRLNRAAVGFLRNVTARCM